MKDIPIDQMDERRLRVELSSALDANRLLLVMIDGLRIETLKDWGKADKLELLEENRRLRMANVSFAPNQIKLRAENKRLEKKEELLDALEAAGVDNWEGYDEALEILRERI